MNHIIAAACPKGDVYKSGLGCVKYVLPGFSGAGLLLGAVIVIVAIGLGVMLFRSPRRVRRTTQN
jgi:hypothetical protein